MKQQLEARGVDEMVIIGVMSHMCVNIGVRAAAEMVYPVTVLHDASAKLDLHLWWRDDTCHPRARVMWRPSSLATPR